jgi:hypothetical protein
MDIPSRGGTKRSKGRIRSMNDRWIMLRVPIVGSSWDPLTVPIVCSGLMEQQQVPLWEPAKGSRGVHALLMTGMLLAVINARSGK